MAPRMRPPRCGGWPRTARPTDPPTGVELDLRRNRASTPTTTSTSRTNPGSEAADRSHLSLTSSRPSNDLRHTGALGLAMKCHPPRAHLPVMQGGGGPGVGSRFSHPCVFESTAGVSPRAQTGTDRLGRVIGSRSGRMPTKGAIMNLKRWRCSITTHKWRRERHEGVDQLHCRRCGFVTNVEDEARQARHWDSSGFMA